MAFSRTIFREDEQLKDKVLIAVTGMPDEMHRSQCEAVGLITFCQARRLGRLNPQ